MCPLQGGCPFLGGSFIGSSNLDWSVGEALDTLICGLMCRCGVSVESC